MPDAQGARRLRREDGGAGLRLDLGLGSHPARRRAQLPDHRLAHAADRDRRAHEEDQARDRHPRAADAQSRRAREAALEHGPAFRRPPAHGDGGGLVQARVRCRRRAVRAARQDHGREPRYPEALLDRGHGERRLAASQDSRRRHVSEARAEAAAADPHRRLRRSGAQAGGRRAATAGSPTSTGPRALRSRGRKCATSRRKPARIPTRS